MSPRGTSFRAHARILALALLASTGAVHGCIQAPGSPADRDEKPRTAEVRRQPAPSHGFNDAIAWWTLEEGLAEAASRQRPLMLVVHAAWCRSCQALKSAFQEDDLVELSREFVMINLDQDRNPRSLDFAPDGDYVPRVVFLEPASGKPDPSIFNGRRTTKRYYYGPRDDLVGAMKKALARHGET